MTGRSGAGASDALARLCTSPHDSGTETCAVHGRARPVAVRGGARGGGRGRGTGLRGCRARAREVTPPHVYSPLRAALSTSRSRRTLFHLLYSISITK